MIAAYHSIRTILVLEKRNRELPYLSPRQRLTGCVVKSFRYLLTALCQFDILRSGPGRGPNAIRSIEAPHGHPQPEDRTLPHRCRECRVVSKVGCRGRDGSKLVIAVECTPRGGQV